MYKAKHRKILDFKNNDNSDKNNNLLPTKAQKDHQTYLKEFSDSYCNYQVVTGLIYGGNLATNKYKLKFCAISRGDSPQR